MDQHGKREVMIFAHFAQVCPIGIQLDSIEKRDPPEPDILCKIKDEGNVAFEMVEVIDEDLAQGIYGKLKLQARLLQ